MTLLNTMIEVEDTTLQITISQSNQTIKMFAVVECTETIKGLSQHTVHQLIMQDKVLYICTGQGQRGKILIAKSTVLAYLEGVA